MTLCEQFLQEVVSNVSNSSFFSQRAQSAGAGGIFYTLYMDFYCLFLII